MDLLPTLSSFALPAVLALLLTLLIFRWRQRGARAGASREALDTVAAWPPEAARVLTIDERHALDLLRRAAPNVLVLAQVPLSRFIRVPTRHSYSDWLQRVGSLSADILVCDSGSRPVAVIDIRAAEESARSRRRHERMARVLREAGVHVITWREGELPSPSQVRSTLAPLLAPSLPGKAAKPTTSQPMPLIPVPEIEEILADGDRAAELADANLEPVPSGFLEELQPAGAPR